MQELDTKIVEQFVMRLRRSPISPEVAEYIANRSLRMLEIEVGDSFRWVMTLIVNSLKVHDFDFILLHQEEFPDVKRFIDLIREELIFSELKIT